MIINTHYIPHSLDKKIRLSDYLIGVFPQLPSRQSIKKAFKKELILVDGKIAHSGLWVAPNMKIELLEAPSKLQKIFKIEFPVLWEDQFLAVIHKPAGYMVSGNSFQTIENALLHNISLSQEIDALAQPRVVHRLDAATSGLLLVAKTKKARMLLGQQFEDKTIKKQYQAIVIGKLANPSGSINTPIEDKKALTQYEVIQEVPSLKNKQLSLLNLYPQTGRRHQLRIHLSQLGHPILGDQVYGTEGMILKHKGMFLVAKAITFSHPYTKKDISINIDTPHKYLALLQREKRRFEYYNSQKLD